ncbi:GntR family transcriptional regulator [Paracoccus nototheniae]|uniref:GntR family transcriptional regulator n=1 Tax=Paracoccus nototheniae TaxID=2489002 RepID=A0ABW4DVS7_9RHOB|nr:GntR family transcriptional regulator [Paracoccus nototheniae]
MSKAREIPASLPGTAGIAVHGNVASQLYDDLRRRIVSLDLPPGTVLLRAELAAEYGVSQTPLREALQRIEQDGLLHVHPQSKTVVSKIDLAQIFEAHFMRVALETEVVRQLARQPSRATMSDAMAIIRMQEAIAGDPDQLRVFQELDDSFHRALFAGLGHQRLHQLVNARSGHLGRMRKMQPHDDAKIRHILDGHKDIVAAILSGDEDKAMAAMRAHLSQTVTNAPDLRAKYPDFFT